MSAFIFVCIVSIAVVFCASDVLEFTDSNFDSKIKDIDLALVEFYAPWCGHCKKLAPEYEKAATRLKSNDPPVPLVKVDCTAEKATCDKFGVSGFPTLKIFRNGELSSDYEGPRESSGIVKYMRGQAGPSSKEINTLAELDKFIDGDEHAVIGFFEKDTRLKDSFQKVADTERDRFRFAHTTSKEVLDKYAYTDDIVIFQPKRLHNKFEESQNRYTGNYDTDKIKKFLMSDMHGLCGVRTTDNFVLFEKPTIVVYYNIDWIKDKKGAQYWRNRVCKVAQEFKGKFTFAVSNREDFFHEIDEYGLNDFKFSKNPCAAAIGKDGQKYPMKTEFSVDALIAFVKDVEADKIEAFVKSEPLPDNNDGPVKVLVGKNFHDIIDGSRDALVEFYAPWCGHCKKLTPIYDELGEALDGENVVIAKMDATANDVPPGFNVQGFPTLYWIPKGKKGSPVAYQGGREFKDFISYVAKESTEPLKKYGRDGKKKKSEL